MTPTKEYIHVVTHNLKLTNTRKDKQPLQTTNVDKATPTETKACFSCLLCHPDRKQSGPVLQQLSNSLLLCFMFHFITHLCRFGVTDEVAQNT